MSAYVVDDKIIHGVVAGLINKSHSFSLSVALIAEMPTDPNKLGAMLLRLNYDAVNYRYNEVGKPPRYKFKPQIPPNDKQLYAMLQELVYQCSEGDIMETEEGESLGKAYNVVAHRVADLATASLKERGWYKPA